MPTLWLSPAGRTEIALRSRIERYAAELDTPSFAPHVTLVTGWPVDEVDLIAEVLSGLTALEIPVIGASGSSEYFRSVVIELEASEELLALRRRAIRIAGLAVEGEFRPHLSLVYGDVSTARRETVRAEVEKDLPPSVHLDRLDLVVTDGPVERWRIVRSHPLPPRP